MKIEIQAEMPGIKSIKEKNSMKKKALVKMAVLMLAMCACMPLAAKAQAEAPAITKGPVTIRMWILDGAETPIYKDLLPKIDAAYPEFTLDFAFYPNDEYYSKLQMSQMVGDTPEIVIMDATELAYYVMNKMVIPLDSYLDATIKADLLQSVLDEGTFSGKLYSTAQFDSGMSFWANKSMLQNAGVRIPTSYKEAWSKNEFEDALVKLKASGVKYPFFMRQNSPKTLYYTYLPIVKGFGGDFMNRQTLLTQGTLNSKETIAAYDYISWLVKSGFVNPLCDYEDAFYARKESAIALIGHWKYKEHIQYLGDDAILVPFPDFGNGVYTGIGSVISSITSTAEKKGIVDLCWKVLNESLKPENISAMTDLNGAIPSRVSVLNTKPQYSKGGLLYLYREQLEDGRGYVRPQTPAHNAIYNVMKTLTAEVFLGGNASKLLNDAAKNMDQLIIENGWNKK
jgi:multiple sugar transport system substrate-binding protein